MKIRKVVTWQELAETFTITNGELWRNGKRVITSTCANYVRVRYGGSMWMYHRVLYMVHHKVSLRADQTVDHIVEGNKLDNHIDNLQVVSHSDNVKKAVKYKLPQLNNGTFILNITVLGTKTYIGRFKSESDYWAAHSKMLRLFGVGTKGLAYVKTLDKSDSKDFIQLAMV